MVCGQIDGLTDICIYSAAFAAENILNMMNTQRKPRIFIFYEMTFHTSNVTVINSFDR